MEASYTINMNLTDELQECILFHGHLCPGLVYGYRVAKEAISLLKLSRSADEETVAICENDSCAIDAIQVLIGTTAGKGNLIIKDYGKNVYTILNRPSQKGYRFSRTATYRYDGDDADEFKRLDEAVASGSATIQEVHRQKLLKAKDLLSKPLKEIFTVQEVPYEELPYAPLARSASCAICGEMTMSTKLKTASDNQLVCIPCYQKS